jgi:hypothetical protein
MQDPANGANPIMQRIIPVLQSNIQEHSVLKYQEQMSGMTQQVMQQMPPEQVQSPSAIEMAMAEAAKQITNANQAMGQAQSPEQQLVALEQKKVELQQQKLQADTAIQTAEIELKNKKLELDENDQIIDIIKSGASDQFKKEKSKADREVKKELKVMEILSKIGLSEAEQDALDEREIQRILKSIDDTTLKNQKDRESAAMKTLNQLAVEREKKEN